ncbi:hypothetical protein OZN62_10740 [Aurantiacibacter sp. MUD11]|nr:hypothetical protein [Aurantiacibacter sp. MUD11]WAT17397.1 hypothetical protein OZN62_10740 [Aurantiacibacter sp. MUD11]
MTRFATQSAAAVFVVVLALSSLAAITNVPITQTVAIAAPVLA